MIKYKASFGEVKPIECERETESFVVIKGISRKTAKRTDWKCFFDSREEAIDWLISKQRKEVEKCDLNLKYELERLEKLEAKFSVTNTKP